MKIIVPIRSVPDPERPIRVEDGVALVTRWIPSRADEVALDTVVRLRREWLAAEIVAAAFGETGEEYLIGALACGADRGYIVDIDGNQTGKVAPQLVDPPTVTQALAEVARREQADLIVIGDDPVDSGETGPRLAGLLNAAQATHVTHIEPLDGGIRVQRALVRSLETLDVPFPAVLTFADRHALPHLVSLYDIAAAREKPVTRLSTAPSSGGLTTVSMEAAVRERRRRIVGSVDELVTALREEARVI